MTTTAISAPPSTIFRSSSSITKLPTLNIPPPNTITFRRRDGNSRFKFSNCFQISKPDFKLHPYIIGENQSASTSGLVSSRLETLVSEFQSLPQPIDRVKRLLDYAMVLPQFNESSRVPANRVAGCAAEVWLAVEMDEIGLMRFKADSDSEITKGFCSCLIFLLDGAYPEEVLKVKAEDLADMNVGLPVRSRVNSWNNVLISMQERTKNLLDERGTLPSLDPFPLVVPADSGAILEGKAFVS